MAKKKSPRRKAATRTATSLAAAKARVQRGKPITVGTKRVVKFPNGRIAVFNKPGTAAFKKGQATKRAVGRKLAKAYGFGGKRKAKRSNRRK